MRRFFIYFGDPISELFNTFITRFALFRGRKAVSNSWVSNFKLLHYIDFQKILRKVRIPLSAFAEKSRKLAQSRTRIFARSENVKTYSITHLTRRSFYWLSITWIGTILIILARSIILICFAEIPSMNLENYGITSDPDRLTFDFLGSRPNGTIKKVVLYQEIQTWCL